MRERNMDDIKKRGGFKKYFDAKIKYRRKILNRIHKLCSAGKIVDAG